jgi:hypothetical protein
MYIKINFVDIIHRPSLIKTRRFGDWRLCSPLGKTAWGPEYVLPDDGYRLHPVSGTQRD